MGKGRIYSTRNGKVRVVRVKGLGLVVTDPKGNVINVKTSPGGAR